jgi:YkoY family integral membrane protein
VQDFHDFAHFFQSFAINIVVFAHPILYIFGLCQSPYLCAVLEQILQDPLLSIAIIGNLVLIETLLSVDNATVLATMVMDLPQEQRKKALRIGILGAYFFRGLAMITASWLLSIWWLKPLGGFYLLFLGAKYFYSKLTPAPEDDLLNKSEKNLYKKLLSFTNPFWSTVVLVELMDMAFSIDNVFAAVAFTDNLILICLGVFIGMLAMRFVAQSFVSLIEKHPYLQTSAFLVIIVLGIKLSLSIVEHFMPSSDFALILGNHNTDLFFSALTLLLFFSPLLVAKFERKKSN